MWALNLNWFSFVAAVFFFTVRSVQLHTSTLLLPSSSIFPADRKALVTQITTCYNKGMQKNTSEHTLHCNLKQVSYRSTRPNWVYNLHILIKIGQKKIEKKVQFWFLLWCSSNNMKTAYMSVAVDCLHPFMTQFGPALIYNVASGHWSLSISETNLFLFFNITIIISLTCRLISLSNERTGVTQLD